MKKHYQDTFDGRLKPNHEGKRRWRDFIRKIGQQYVYVAIAGNVTH